MSRRRSRLPYGAPVLVVLLAGVAVTAFMSDQRTMELGVPLAKLPDSIAGYSTTSEDSLADYAERSLRPDDYVLRTYRNGAGGSMELFVAYYGRQEQGSGIHSPRNCLPGSGWEATERRVIPIEYGGGTASVNRYLVKHESGARAVVYYWYQGRGRIQANEYLVKWSLLLDAASKRRTDEALVRVVYPVSPGRRAPSDAEAAGVLATLASELHSILPAG